MPSKSSNFWSLDLRPEDSRSESFAKRLKVLRRLAIAGVILLVLVGAVWLAIRAILGGDAITNAIESQASAAIGRPVVIREASPHLFPRVGLDLNGISIGAKREVTIDSATLTTGLWALVRRRVEDAQISIVRS